MSSEEPRLAAAEPGVVTVWSDLSCPWASLALATLHERAAVRGGELLFDHRAFPLELFNKIPTPRGIVESEVVLAAGVRPDLG